MKILSIDTASDICSVALLEDTNLIKELNILDSKTHSENLMPLIEQLLEQTNCDLSEIDLIACDKGPGSFTGIRIGISTVKAFSFVHNIPVLGISSLDALAYNVEKTSNIICSLIDAKNNQVYCGIYNDKYELLEDYLADDISIIVNTLKKYSDITYVGNGSIIHKNLLNGVFVNNNEQSAFSLGKCAYYKFIKGIQENADNILPMYLRKSQAERMQNKN